MCDFGIYARGGWLDEPAIIYQLHELDEVQDQPSCMTWRSGAEFHSLLAQQRSIKDD